MRENDQQFVKSFRQDEADEETSARQVLFISALRDRLVEDYRKSGGKFSHPWQWYQYLAEMIPTVCLMLYYDARREDLDKMIENITIKIFEDSEAIYPSWHQML